MTKRSPEDPVSAEELAIFELVAEGLTNEEIAARLKISSGTTRNRILLTGKKMGTHGRDATMLSLFATGRMPLPPLDEPYEPHRLDRLTEREIGIVRTLAQQNRGTNRQVGSELGRTEGVVRNELGIIMDKLGVASRTLVLVKALQIGVLPLSDISSLSGRPDQSRINREQVFRS